MSLLALDPKTRKSYSFIDSGEFIDAMKSGFVPMNEDGNQAAVVEFEGGYLVDGAPLNVWTKGVWYEGQAEILTPFWDNGSIPVPPDALMGLPIVVMPDKVLQDYAAYKGVPEAQTALEAYKSGGSGFDLQSILSSPMTLAAVAVGAVLLFSGGRRKRATTTKGEL